VRINTTETGVRFTVRVQPRASRSEIAGAHGEAVRIRVTAAPVDGDANQELVGFLAKRFRVPKSNVHIVKGERGRDKVVEIEGVSEDGARRLLDVVR
jgi:uncharacterized protein (TIGR00251 family)